MKNTKIYKAHYDYKSFDTNIPEYVEYIVNINRQKMQDVKSVISDFISFSYSLNDHKITYQMFYNYLTDEGYSMRDIKEYYNQLNDILKEHNRLIDSPSHVEHEIDKKLMEGRIKDKKSLENMTKLVDTFGSTVIETNDKRYVLTNALRKKGKK